MQSYLRSLNGSRNDQETLHMLATSQENAFRTVSTQATSYVPPTDNLDYMSRDITSILEKTKKDDDLIQRQYEINEWSNANKLDTLFFMQILFICLTFISTMLFLKTHGFITPYIFKILAILAGIIACGTLVLRARYTSVVRDTKYWHRSRFPSEPNPFPTVTTVTASSDSCS